MIKVNRAGLNIEDGVGDGSKRLAGQKGCKDNNLLRFLLCYPWIM
jgi:hypothetical protein